MKSSGPLKERILLWCGVDTFVLRLLRLAVEIFERDDEAQDLFLKLRDEGFLAFRLPRDMPRGRLAAHYKQVPLVELLIERLRLAPTLAARDGRLAEFAIRQCLADVREIQCGRELFQSASNPLDELPRLYRALAGAMTDCAGSVEQELWSEIRCAAAELEEQDNREACVAAFDQMAAVRPC